MAYTKQTPGIPMKETSLSTLCVDSLIRLSSNDVVGFFVSFNEKDNLVEVELPEVETVNEVVSYWLHYRSYVYRYHKEAEPTVNFYKACDYEILDPSKKYEYKFQE